MSHVYVWKPRAQAGNGSNEVFGARFRAILEPLRVRYEQTYGRPFTTRVREVGETCVGLLHTTQGIAGWSPWLEGDERGVAWSGVCEDYLGAVDTDAVASEVARTVLERPVATSEWHGAFSAVAWDLTRGEVGILTSATEPQPLWKTSGPNGWAVGTRARPLLDLVGREPELDEVQAALLLSFGYLAGDGSLFRNVDRVPSRRVIRVRRNEDPIEEVYVTLPDFLARSETRDLGFDDTVEIAADRLRERVATQLRHSTDPMLSLTGGRDSRCIAAALHSLGYDGPAQTGGALDSPDVVVAARVARSLGFTHHRSGGAVDALGLMAEHVGRARTWTELTEGIETIRHALHFPRFFLRSGEPNDVTHQMFNGLTPGLTVRNDGVWGRDAVLARVDPALHASVEARSELHEISERLARDVRDAGGDPEDWQELFFWQNRAQHWGQDNASAKLGLTWWWTPLMHGSLVRASWWLPRETKRSKAMVHSMTLRLAPQLRDVPYDTMPSGPWETLWKRVLRRLPGSLGKSTSRPFQAAPDWRGRWESFLFERESPVWPGLIHEARVRDVLDSNTNAHLLWSIATVELFADAHLRSPGAGPVMPFDERIRDSDTMEPE